MVRHRFVDEAGMEIDVLPIRLGDGAEKVLLPDGELISQVGLAEAIESAVAVSVSRGSVRVARLPVLAAIKLHVATIRADDRDLCDTSAVSTQYEFAGARRFDIDYITEGDLSWDTAGAWLAGRDARALLRPRSRTAVQAAVLKLTGDVRLSDRYAGESEKRSLLAAFCTGLAAPG